jgi:hypothetical protein
MKLIQRILIFLLVFLTILSCKKSDIMQSSTSISTLTGKWKLTGIFLGDAIATPCYGSTPTRDITLEFTASSSGIGTKMSLNGQATINNYFGSYEADSKGVIKISSVGSTQMGGSQEMMECETNYFTFLAASEAYKIIQDGTNPVKTVLQLGVFRNNPKDSGTYLIFEKN